MNLYAESSAVLAWLLSEKAKPSIRAALATAETVVSSDLTLIECDRAIWRAVALGKASETVASGLKRRLARITVHWDILHLSPQIVERARQPFPAEPIRTLDALHVASALFARAAVPELALLSLDERIRRVGKSLGFALEPY